MRVTNEQLKLFLADSNLVPKDRLEEVSSEAEKNGKQIGPLLLERGLIDEAGLQKVYAYVLGIPFVDLVKESIPLEILQIVPEPIARKYNIVAFEKQDRNLKVAMLVPEDLQTIDFIRKKTGFKIIPCLTTRASASTGKQTTA